MDEEFEGSDWQSLVNAIVTQASRIRQLEVALSSERQKVRSLNRTITEMMEKSVTNDPVDPAID